MIKRNERGVAMLLALVAMMIMAFLASQIGSRSALEYEAGLHTYEDFKAYHLAKIGVEISRLRIYIYRKAMAQYGSQLGPMASQLDMIWSLPFTWPPQALPGASTFDKEALDEAVKGSLIDGVFGAYIDGESGKIDVNDLASPSDALAKATNAQLVKILQDRLDQDDAWAHEMRGVLKPQEIINNIADYIDEDSESRNGGDESSPYKGDVKPANRPLKTIEELHQVAGVTDEIYKILAPRLTVYGAKGINVNRAPTEVLKSIDPQITDDVAKAIQKRKSDPDQGGPFKDENDFLGFLSDPRLGVNTQTFNKEHPVPLLFDSEFNFRIKSFGEYRHAKREIVAIVYDFDKVKVQLGKLTAASPTPTPNPNNPPGQPPPPPAPSPSPAADTGPTGPPPIVFWQEL